MSTIPLQRAIEYPESDGKPMAETPVHGRVMIDLIQTLERRYADAPDVWAWGNMMFYWVEGDPKSCLAPDVFVAKGVGKGERRVYKVWEEGRAPSLIVEVTSRSTRDEDLEDKKKVYEELGVEEYLLFDPLGEYLRPRLQGFRLGGPGRGYRPIAPEADGSLRSEVTGLLLKPEGKRLRLRDAVTGEPLRWPDEIDDAWRAAEERAAAAEERLRALEAELARLRSPRG